MPLCTIFTKCPAPTGPQCSQPSSSGVGSPLRPGRAVDVAHARSDGLPDRRQVGDRAVLATDHQAEPTLEAEHTTTGADVDVVDALGPEHLGAVDVVAVVRVAAVDDDVAGVESPGDVHHRRSGIGGGHHHPRGAGRLERGDELVEVGGTGDGVALGSQRRDGIGAHVVDHAGVAVTHEATHQVGAHAPETDHSELHLRGPFVGGARGGQLPMVPAPTGCRVDDGEAAQTPSMAPASTAGTGRE